MSDQHDEPAGDEESSDAGDTAGAKDDAEGPLDRLENVPLVGGFLGGVFSFLAGYALFLGLLSGTGEAPFDEGTQTALESVARAFYNAFNVPTFQERTIEVAQGNATREFVIKAWTNRITGYRKVTQQNLLDGQVVNETTQTTTAQTGLELPGLVYLAVPVVALIAVGFVVGHRMDLDTDDPNAITVKSLGGGVAMALGFLLVALTGTYLLVIEGTNAILYPARMQTVLYSLVYPVVAGTAGIALGAVIQTREMAHERGEDTTGSNDTGDTEDDESDTDDEDGDEPDDETVESRTGNGADGEGSGADGEGSDADVENSDEDDEDSEDDEEGDRTD